jgi:hypothetical protein
MSHPSCPSLTFNRVLERQQVRRASHSDQPSRRLRVESGPRGAVGKRTLDYGHLGLRRPARVRLSESRYSGGSLNFVT